MRYRCRTPDGFEAFVETPFDGFFDRFIEDEGEEGDGEEAELGVMSVAFCVLCPALSDQKEGRESRAERREPRKDGVDIHTPIGP